MAGAEGLRGGMAAILLPIWLDWLSLPLLALLGFVAVRHRLQRGGARAGAVAGDA